MWKVFDKLTKKDFNLVSAVKKEETKKKTFDVNEIDSLNKYLCDRNEKLLKSLAD